MLEEIKSFNPDQIDIKFKEYLTKVRPMTGAGVVELLNRCVRLIDSDKCYFEVGTHRGSTLLGAALGNTVQCIGIDDFSGHNSPHEISPFSSTEEGLKDGISRLSSGNVKYYKTNYQDYFLNREDVDGRKIEVYFYDGDHSAEHQYLGVRQALPLLSDEALVIIDDSANNDSQAVHAAVDALLKDNLGLTFVVEFIPPKPNDYDGMWCGVIILKFDRKNYVQPTTFSF